MYLWAIFDNQERAPKRAAPQNHIFFRQILTLHQWAWWDFPFSSCSPYIVQRVFQPSEENSDGVQWVGLQGWGGDGKFQFSYTDFFCTSQHHPFFSSNMFSSWWLDQPQSRCLPLQINNISTLEMDTRIEYRSWRSLAELGFGQTFSVYWSEVLKTQVLP